MTSDKPIPLAWGKALTVTEQSAVKALRDEGCDCDYPNLAFSIGKPLIVCFRCGTIATLELNSKPSFEESSSTALEKADDLYVAS